MPGLGRQNESGASEQFYHYFCYAALLFVLLLFGYIRLRLLSFPLERDEGEYAYAAQLLLKSLNPYALCHSMKLPGTALAYALIMLAFG